jgi:signal transduction histidine kinase
MPDNYSYTNLSWQILIEDTGPGISQEDLKHIFDPFFTTKEKGYGLGLAIAHNIISEHLGKIFAESHPGTGTRFFIHLPMVKEGMPSLEEGTDEVRVGGIKRH